MAAHRYWRLVGFSVPGNGPLELSEARIYAAGVLADETATLSCTFSPTTGALADLRDGFTTGSVSWLLSAHSSAGFALVWDFGAGQGVEYAQLQLGACGAAGTFPLDLMFQYSDDGQVWLTHQSYSAIAFPGPQSVTHTPWTEGDPVFDKVKLLLHGDGANGSSVFTDVCGHTVTPVGDAHISTAQTTTGGSVMAFDGAGDCLTIPSSTDFDLGTLYTVEVWIYPRSISSNFGIVHRGFYTTTNYLWTGAFAFSTRWLGGSDAFLRVAFYATSNETEQYVDIPNAFLEGAWTHFAVTREGTVGKVWINGALAGTRTGLLTPDASNQPLKIGLWDYSAGAEYFNGYLQDLRITVGAARYSGNFTPPATRLPGPLDTGLTSGALLPRMRQHLQPQRYLPTAAQPAGTATGHLREHTFFDAYHGGTGIIYGTVKEQHAPANTPWRRRVLLIDERSRVAVRETWSDAVTGNYEFRGIREGVKYTVLSYDHTGQYGAAVGDNITPEIINVA